MEKPKKRESYDVSQRYVDGKDMWGEEFARANDERTRQHNRSIEESDAWHNFVMEPVVEVFAKYAAKTVRERCRGTVMCQMWNAIQESIKRNNNHSLSN